MLVIVQTKNLISAQVDKSSVIISAQVGKFNSSPDHRLLANSSGPNVGPNVYPNVGPNYQLKNYLLVLLIHYRLSIAKKKDYNLTLSAQFLVWVNIHFESILTKCLILT